MSLTGWNQSEVEHHYIFDQDTESKREIRRQIPSPESVHSIAPSSFNFDDLEVSLNDLQREIIERRPVQHPSENDNNLSDHVSTENENIKISNISEETLHPIRHHNEDDSFNQLSMSTAVSDNLHSHVNNWSSEQYQTYRSDGPGNYLSFNPAQRPMPNHYMVANQHHFNSLNGPPVVQQRFQTAAAYHTKQHLVDGYSSAPSNIGFPKSFSHIQGPDPVFGNDSGYQLEGSRESVEDDLSNSYFHTVNVSEQYNEPPQPHVPRIYTVSANIPDGTQAFRTPAPPQQAAQPIKEKVKVFVTYAQEAGDDDHIRTVVQISQTLFKNSIDVTVDVLEETVRAMSISDWLESNISTSDFVLICVSPSYRQVVDGQSTSRMQQNESAVNTQYIYRRIHAEYINQGSKNYRFIPVLVSGAKGHHIPLWLKDTKVFEWPKDYEDIIYRLFRQEKFVKPKPGPAPKHTIERYSSISSQSSSNQSPSSKKSKQSKSK